jgi:hypothetical protein
MFVIIHPETNGYVGKLPSSQIDVDMAIFTPICQEHAKETDSFVCIKSGKCKPRRTDEIVDADNQTAALGFVGDVTEQKSPENRCGVNGDLK